MADSDKALSSGVEILKVSPTGEIRPLGTEIDEASRNEKEVEQVEVGQESFGAPPDDEALYVKGYPVIRSGTYLVSRASPPRDFFNC